MFKQLFQRWLGLPTGASQVALDCSSSNTLDAREAAKVQVTVFYALNGTVLQVGTFKSNPHGPDWIFRLYIVQPGESLSDAIATCLVVTAGQA